MFWADKLVGEIKEKYAEKIKAGKPLIIRDEKTMSGRVHVGSLRGVAIHGIIAEILSEQKVKNKYLYEINDFDPMDGLPIYLDQEKFKPYMGMLLCDVPSPDGKAKNYAEYFAQEFMQVIKEAGFKPEHYRSSDLYKQGKYNEVIKIAIENSEKIREIYRKVSGSEKGNEWLPVQMICQKCGKIGTTKAVAFDGQEVEYVCEENMVKWAKGCGYRGKNSPFDGNAKLPWKVEWAAKFKVLEVDIEGAGKDHSTRGGSREIAEAISREVFGQVPPFNIPYEFFQVGGKKMSSSKGAGSSSKEIADLLPPELLRLLLLSKEPRKVIEFIPDGDTIPILYDLYDKMAESYFKNEESDYARIFKLIHISREEKLKPRFLPRFSQMAFIVQTTHLNNYEAVEKMKESSLTVEDKEEVNYRADYVKRWLEKFAPEDYRYELQEKSVPEGAKNFSAEQKKALALILQYIESQEKLDGQALHTKLHEIKEQTKINPKDLFSAIYLSFLGKPSGPKAGWFLSVLDREFFGEKVDGSYSINPSAKMNEKIKIVKMREKDLPAIFKIGKEQWLNKSWFGMNYIKSSFKQKGLSYIAKISNEVVGGIIMVREDIVKNWIHYLIVDKNYREMGIGSELLKKIIDHLKKGESIFVDTGVTYKSAIKFYEKQGFKNRGKVMSLYGNDQAYIFEKNIK